MSVPRTWFAMPSDDVLRELAVDSSDGLSCKDVAQRRERFGWNTLAEAPPVSRWKRLLGQFKELVIWILIVVGNSAKNLLLRRIFGETALQVIQNADRPLFLA